MQGWRPEMEDRHHIRLGLDFGLDEWSFFAIFDGHAGKRAATFAAYNLLDYILRDSQFNLKTDSHPRRDPIQIDSKGQLIQEIETSARLTGGKDSDSVDSSEGGFDSTNLVAESVSEIQTTDEVSRASSENPEFSLNPLSKQLSMVESAIKSAFLELDASLRRYPISQEISGSTAICALVSPTHIFLANCGDSRAVLGNNRTVQFCTEDHKPHDEREKLRIVAAGGTVGSSQRINGCLNVSRSLGDFEFKRQGSLPPCKQLVSPEPEVTIIERNPRDDFLILACDGVWDVISNEDILKYVEYKSRIEPKLENICSAVLDVCLHKGSKDNMSIIIVSFEGAPKIDKLAIDLDLKNDEIILKAARSILEKDMDDLSFQEFLAQVEDELIMQSNLSILPPGAGIEGKYDILHELWDTWFNADKS